MPLRALVIRRRCDQKLAVRDLEAARSFVDQHGDPALSRCRQACVSAWGNRLEQRVRRAGA